MDRHLYTYEYVRLPYDDIALLLAEDAPSVFQHATESAVEHGDTIVAELRVELGRFELGRSVAVELGDFEPRGIRTVSLPLRWQATEAAALFPSLEAKLEVSALALHPPITQVSLIAAYRPPFGPIGAAGDALVGHRVAEVVLHRFLRDVVTRIEERAAQMADVHRLVSGRNDAE